MGEFLPVLAVVDAVPDQSVVWWVNLGTTSGLTSRLCGAWVLPVGTEAELFNLLSGRLLLATEAGARRIDRSVVDTCGMVDADATVAAVTTIRAELDAAYQVKRAETPKGKKGPVPPAWPETPVRLDREDPPLPYEPEPVGRAVGIARWFDRLCRAWDRIEQQRLARTYMRHLGGPTHRLLPVATAGRAGATQ